MGAWPAPTVGPPPPAASSAPTQSKRAFTACGLIAAAIAAALLAVFIWRGSGETEFEQRRAQAEALEADAASAEKWAVGVSPRGWAVEEWTVDRTSRSHAVDRWQGDGAPTTSGPPTLSLLFIGDSNFIRTTLFDDPSSNEPTWYLNEDSEGMDPARFEELISSPWYLLDEHTDNSPQPAGTERVDNEQLDRFDLTIPADAFDQGMLMSIGTVGLLDPSIGIDLSFWFTEEGELRRLSAKGEGERGSFSYEYSSQLFSNATLVEAPVAPRSWSEFRALQD